MNNQNRRAGKSTRQLAEGRYRSRFWFVVVLGIAALVALLLATDSTVIKVTGGFGFLGLIILARILMDVMDIGSRRMAKKERQAIRGAEAEEGVEDILDELDKEQYFVIHDVPSPYGNIDHVVINNRGGVFLLETKSHGGKVWVEDGQLLVNGNQPEKDFIAQTLRNAYWLRDVISEEIGVKPWINTAVVFANAFVESSQPIKGVSVINKKYMLRFLEKSSSKAQNQAIWEHRDHLHFVLSPDQISVS